MITQSSDETIPEIKYTELKPLNCPKCENPLSMEDPGYWFCESGSECNYEESNNITRCQNDTAGCDNLVLSNDFNFDDMEERYCQIPHPEGGSCLGYAYGEQDAFLAEQYALEEHMKNCNSETCDCRNV